MPPSLPTENLTRASSNPHSSQSTDSISDQLLPANSRIDFIKVDIEGHEDFFQGAFWQSLKIVVILTEVNPGFQGQDISASELTINNLRTAIGLGASK